MSASFILRPEGLPRIEGLLATLADRHEDLSPLMDVLGMAMETSTIQRFEDEEAPDGSKWTPSIRAKETGGKTLTDTARLKQSITYRAGSDEVEVGTNVIYAGVHQRGGGEIREHKRTMTKAFGRMLKSPIEVIVPTHNSNIPARPFLGISAEDLAEIEALVEDYSTGGLQ